MKKWYFLGLALLAVPLLIFFITTYKNKRPKLISPVSYTKTMFSENIWFPKEASDTAQVDFSITSKAALLVDNLTGEILFSKNSKERLPIASLVKIMTAIVALEQKDFNDVYTISPRATQTEPDNMLLIPNEKLTLEELLSGIFLVSANDAAEVLAEGTTGRREEFLTLMNSKALALGMKDTLFINPTGLEEDKPQYSTAFDAALMSHYAIKRWPKLLEITKKDHIYIPKTLLHQDYDLYSGINLITSYPGVIGFKTGFTYEAGLTLVTFAQREGREVLGVLLGSGNRRDDARILLDYSFEKLGVHSQ